MSEEYNSNQNPETTEAAEPSPEVNQQQDYSQQPNWNQQQAYKQQQGSYPQQA